MLRQWSIPTTRCGSDRSKRDVVDATRDVRTSSEPVWMFDPQGIALEKPAWWWNPLSSVTDELRGRRYGLRRRLPALQHLLRPL